jgi:ferric-dicitrate binding protein FerR (iron transport regulator)
VAGETAMAGPGQLLETQQGHAEILLTPGAFLRMAENSAVKLDASSPKSVRVELVRGEVLVEMVQVDKLLSLDIVDKGADARLEKAGIYDFNATQPAIAIYDGKVRVEDDRRVISLGKGEELALAGDGPLKPRKFNLTETNPVYAWSRQRADYDARASEWTAESLIALDGASQYATGWYWNPWFKSWAFMPARPYRVSPFGYGYYAPNAPQYMAPVFGDFR